MLVVVLVRSGSRDALGVGGVGGSQSGSRDTLGGGSQRGSQSGSQDALLWIHKVGSVVLSLSLSLSLGRVVVKWGAAGRPGKKVENHWRYGQLQYTPIRYLPW